MNKVPIIPPHCPSTMIHFTQLTPSLSKRPITTASLKWSTVYSVRRVLASRIKRFSLSHTHACISNLESDWLVCT